VGNLALSKGKFLHLSEKQNASLRNFIRGKGTASASLSHPRTMDSIPALIAALAICAVLGAISLLVPPFIHNDSGSGFLAWRGTLRGAANSIISPDHADIARDTVSFVAGWSPGQYLVPGAISMLGVPLGIAMTLTVALGLVTSLIGWVMVVRAFAPRTSLAILVVLLIGSFHYSTHSFSTYHGGEILLQAATPWLILTAYQVPEMKAIPAALVAGGAVFFAFFAKVTGLIVVGAALVAGSMVTLAFGRRITRGMIAGALGAVAALVVLYLNYFSRGWTPASETSWSLPLLSSIAFFSLAPLVVGISWPDPIYLVIPRFFYVPAVHVACLVPPALLVIGLVLFWRPQTTNEKKFRLFSLWFSAIVVAAFILLAAHSIGFSAEERYFRSAGTLLFVCALISALAAGTPRWTRGLFLVLCALMALYGLASFSYHELATAKGQWLDRTSWTNQDLTNQRIFDAAAVDFLRKAFAQEGRDALFVLPSYQLAVTLPTDARIIAIDFNAATRSEIQNRRYAGRVAGHIFVLMPNTMMDAWTGSVDMSKGPALLSVFKDYAPDAWERRTFANMSVFFQ
jgi:hypothetical protein